MLSIQIGPSTAFGEKLYGLSKRLRSKWNARMESAGQELKAKVLENLDGKILQKRSGQLYDSIELDVYTEGYDFIAFVGPVPATPKAMSLEFGGKGDYLIPIGAKGVLANKDTGFFSKSSVIHPPSKEYAYLRTALEEIEASLPGELAGVSPE